MRARDRHGIALAYHCLAIDYQLLAMVDENERREKDFAEAVRNHVLHRNHSDLVGRFVAHVNLGICFGHLQDTEASNANHQCAFELAKYMKSQDATRLSTRNFAFDSGLFQNPETRMQVLSKVLNDHYDGLNKITTDIFVLLVNFWFFI